VNALSEDLFVWGHNKIVQLKTAISQGKVFLLFKHKKLGSEQEVCGSVINHARGTAHDVLQERRTQFIISSTVGESQGSHTVSPAVIHFCFFSLTE